jgi:hypothetical protein
MIVRDLINNEQKSDYHRRQPTIGRDRDGEQQGMGYNKNPKVECEG